jgi:hypothetical protein
MNPWSFVRVKMLSGSWWSLDCIIIEEGKNWRSCSDFQMARAAETAAMVALRNVVQRVQQASDRVNRPAAQVSRKNISIFFFFFLFLVFFISNFGPLDFTEIMATSSCPVRNHELLNSRFQKHFSHAKNLLSPSDRIRERFIAECQKQNCIRKSTKAFQHSSICALDATKKPKSVQDCLSLKLFVERFLQRFLKSLGR